MASQIYQIADAVRQIIQDASEAGVLGGGFTPELRWRPRPFKASELVDLKVQVIPVSSGSELQSRSSTEHTWTVMVGVQKLLASDDEIPGLVELCEKIRDVFLGKQIVNAVCECYAIGASTEPVVSIEDVEQQQQFTSVVMLQLLGATRT